MKRPTAVRSGAWLGHGSTNKSVKTKKAKDIIIGDKITLATGETRTATSVSNGMYCNSTLIEWKNGWSCQHNSTEIVVA